MSVYACLLPNAGLRFWKVGSRKVYAVKQSYSGQPSGKGPGKGRRHSRASEIVIPSDSDSESDFLPATKRKAVSGSEIRTLTKEVGVIQQELRKIFTISSGLTIPIALRQKLSDTFKCNICQVSPISPPVIFARCCKSIIGCQTCVDRWYRGEEGMSKGCPLCGTERALPETTRLHGLDDFLVAVQPLMDAPARHETQPEPAE